nr:hypothetical protein [Tanacetum cinerariifolium]
MWFFPGLLDQLGSESNLRNHRENNSIHFLRVSQASSSDSSSRHSSPDHSSSDLQSTSAGPSHKRRRSPMTFVPALPLVSGALSSVRADLIPPPKR